MLSKVSKGLLILFILIFMFTPFVSIFKMVLAQDTIVDDTTDGNMRYAPAEKSFYAKDRYWLFYSNVSYYPGWKSSIDGVTWSSFTTITNTAQNSSTGLTAVLDNTGNYVHVIWYNNSPQLLLYRMGELNTNGTINWLAPNDTIVSGDLIYYPSLTMDSSNKPCVSYTNKDEDKVKVDKSSTVNGTWTSDTGFPISIKNSVYNIISSIHGLSNNKLVVLYVNDDGAYIQAKRYTGSSWGSEITSTLQVQKYAHWDSSTGTGDEIHITGLEFTTWNVKYVKYDYSSNSFVDISGSLGTVVNKVVTEGLVMGSDEDNNAYVFWRPEDNKVNVNVRNDLGIWSGEILWFTDTDTLSDIREWQVLPKPLPDTDTNSGIALFYIATNIIKFKSIGETVDVTTNTPVSISETSANFSGSITSLSFGNADYRGFYYGLTPTETWSIEETGSFGIASYTLNSGVLLPNTTYWVKAYAGNDFTYGEGSWIEFQTDTGVPTMTTYDAIAIGESTATLRGELVSTGGLTVTERGFLYNTQQSETGASEVSETGSFSEGTYNIGVSSLESGTVYFYKAFAENLEGLGYGDWQVFLTSGVGEITYPDGGVIVATQDAGNITGVSAYLNAYILDIGNATCTSKGFEWGESTNYGNNWTQTGNYTIGIFNHEITGLTAGTTYHFRTKAYNSYGWSYGQDLSFTASTGDPIITTLDATYVGKQNARLNAFLNNDGGSITSVKFLYTNDAGNWTQGDTGWISGYYTGYYAYSDLTSLSGNTTYYYRALAENAAGNSTGSIGNFTTTETILNADSFLAIPRLESPAVDLSWITANNTSQYMIRYKIADYPSSIVDGDLVVLTNKNSYSHEELNIGETYYYSLWGVSGNETSSTYLTAIATVNISPDLTPIPIPDTPGNWFLTADYTRMSEFPIYDSVNYMADSMGMQRNLIWVMLAFLIAAAVFITIYFQTRSMLWSSIATISWLTLASSMGLVAGYQILILIVFTIGINVGLTYIPRRV